MGEAAKKIFLASMKDPPSHVWEGSSSKGFGGVTNYLDLDLKLGNSKTCYAQARDKKHYKNHAFDQVDEKNLINGSSATPGAGVNFNPNQNQASKLGLDLDKSATKLEDLQRQKRLMANRISSKKYRMKKYHYMDHLEKQINALRLKISNIRQQIEMSTNEQQALLIEQHHLKFKIAAVERDKLLKEVETGRKMAEVHRLRELHFHQLQARQQAMRNSNDGLQVANTQLDLNLKL